MNTYDPLELKKRIVSIAIDIALEFKLPLRSLEFIKVEHEYGKCSAQGDLKIKIEWPDGELVPEMEVWRTLGHELAHLKHFNHGDDFWEFNRTLVNRISEMIQKKIRPEIAVTRRGVIY
jgi:predicted metal-dependent hydrolase